jgi:hypothetical protein
MKAALFDRLYCLWWGIKGLWSLRVRHVTNVANSLADEPPVELRKVRFFVERDGTVGFGSSHPVDPNTGESPVVTVVEHPPKVTTSLGAPGTTWTIKQVTP